MQEPYLSQDQQIALFHAVGRRIASIVTGTRGVRIADQVPEIATIPLLGAFVSLKRNGELRSCMGTMSDRMPLGEAIEQATLHAAKDDPRFAPLAAAELFELDLEIWLLWGMKRVAERGADRLRVIEIGRHGVQISRGGNRGLLLPGVAVEHQMNAKAFLEAVCRKAGLPADAWLDDRSLLHIFEGRSIRGPLSATENIDKKTADEMIFAAKFNRLGPRVPGPTRAETEALRSVCMTTFKGMVDGLAPSHYFTGLFDGNVSGTVLSFQIPDRPPLVCSKISVRPDVRLQESIIELLRVLGRQVERFGVTLHELRDVAIDLAVFWDPTIHGNANCYDLGSVDTGTRAVMLSSPKGWIVQYDPGRDAETILKDGVDFIELADLDLGEVISFEAQTTTPKILVTSVSKPNRGVEIRPPVVAGSFYPTEVKELDAELDRMLRGMSGRREDCLAALIPHAGWCYSGRLAAQTLARIKIPRRVMIFAPKHRGSGIDWAVAPNRVWKLPGENVETDLEFAEELLRRVDFFDFDAEAHRQEHAIEVQLPILARLSPRTRIVGVAQGVSSWGMIRRGAAQFAEFLETLDEKPLLIISSDMNHYANDETTRKVDRVALDALKAAVDQGRPEILLDTVRENQISMCGVIPAVFVLETLRLLGKPLHIKEVGYTTSAEAYGDTTRVVGYAGLLLQKSRG